MGVYVDHQKLQSYGNRELLKIHDCKLNVQVCVLQSIRMFVFIHLLYIAILPASDSICTLAQR